MREQIRQQGFSELSRAQFYQSRKSIHFYWYFDTCLAFWVTKQMYVVLPTWSYFCNLSGNFFVKCRLQIFENTSDSRKLSDCYYSNHGFCHLFTRKDVEKWVTGAMLGLISLGEGNTILIAYTLYRHLG